MTSLKPGSRVGHWQVNGLSGRGDVSDVYEAHDDEGHVASLKLFKLEMSRAQIAWAHFERESQAFVQAAAGVAAPASAYGIEAETRLPYVVRERIAFDSLYEEVLRTGPIAVPRVAAILQAVAPGLDAAHAQGLVHRGLKPQNVFAAPGSLGSSVAVRLTDSSTYILRVAVRSGPGWAGTPGWVAPDAADPNAPSAPRMDLYALGLVCFFALTGRPLFKALGLPAIDYDVLWNEMVQPIQAASQQARDVGSALGSALDPWFAQAVAPLPRSRFASASEMAAQFAVRVGGLASAMRSASQPAAQHRRGATQLGLGPLPLGGTVRLDPAQSARAPNPLGAEPAMGQAVPRAGSGTLIMDYSAAVAAATTAGKTGPATPARTLLQFGQPTGQEKLEETTFPEIGSEQGPVVLASGQPLAFMRELPRSAAAQPERDSETGGRIPGAPQRRAWLLPLLLFGGGGLLALGVLAGWALSSRKRSEPDLEANRASAATGSAASAHALTAQPASEPNPEPAPKPDLAEPSARIGNETTAGVSSAFSFECEPRCERIECDGRPIDPPGSAVLLSAGRHTCRFERAGFVSKVETITATPGRQQTRSVRLVAQRPESIPRTGNTVTPSAAPKKRACGTFINPCK